MAGKSRDLSIAWPFAPREVKLNRDTNFIKIAAMVAMFIDHAGKMLFPQYRVMRIIGRLAFPIYAYCLSVGVVHTRDFVRYVERMLFLALISQPLYAVAMGHSNQTMYLYSFTEKPLQAAVQFYTYSWNKPSILLALIVGLVAIWSIRERRLVLTLAIAVLTWLIQDKLDYGWKGVVLMVLFYLFCDKPLLSFPLVVAFMFWWGTLSSGYRLFSVRFGTQMFALMALPFIYIPMHTGIKLNKWVFYLFYPAHLVVILLLDKFVF